VSILDERTPLLRPPSIPASRHLHLEFHDIAEPAPGYRSASAADIGRLIDFVGSWDAERPLVIHCFAGISRSTASAFIALCAIDAARDEAKAAALLRRMSPTAFPNPLMVRLADGIMHRGGRMSAAIAAMEPPVGAIESEPFALSLRG
jgi:predicted protein tyrosine phosphatase